MIRSLRGAVSTLVALALIGAPVHAQHFPPDSELQGIIQDRVEAGRAVGIVLGVMEADGSTRVFWAGEAGPGARELDAESVFEIGSISKAFTGILLAEAVRRGEVELDSPIQAHLPGSVRMPRRGDREITFLDVATHRSALPRLPGNMAPADMTNPYADYTVDMMYEFLSGHELRRDIGAEFEYSNLAVGLMGHALARAAGTDYETLVKDRILGPLGMTRSGITLDAPMRARMVKGHNQAGAVVPNWDLPALEGAGALRSNMVDMLAFLDANMGEASSDLERSMRDSHVARADAGPGGRIGLNWIIREVAESSIVWHNGGTGGFRTFMGFDPRSGVGAVVLTNSGHGADDIGFHVLNPSLPLARSAAPLPRAPTLDDEEGGHSSPPNEIR